MYVCMYVCMNVCMYKSKLHPEMLTEHVPIVIEIPRLEHKRNATEVTKIMFCHGATCNKLCTQTLEILPTLMHKV